MSKSPRFKPLSPSVKAPECPATLKALDWMAPRTASPQGASIRPSPDALSGMTASVAQVEALAEMGRPDLLTLWQGLNGTPAPPQISQSMLRRILAFDVQATALGGLPTGFRAQLARALPDTRRAPVMATGTRFIREWNGVTHVVEKSANGYLWNGATHTSHIAIAERITDAHWSGPRFFGVTSILIAKVKKGSTP